MEPITDATALRERIRSLFPTDIIPRASVEIIEVEHEAGLTELRFITEAEAANQLGFVQGGLVATMLDGCMGTAGAVASGGVLAMPMAEFKANFVRPVPVGFVRGHGRTVRLGRTVAFLEGVLLDEAGRTLATASGTAVPTPFPD